MSLVDAANKLGRDTLVMDSYYNFQSKKFHWFFSPNPKLNSATERPKSFSTWEHWDSLAPNKKRTLSSLAGFKEDATNIIRNNNDLGKLKTAYTNWRKDLYSVFWGNEKTGVWTCNIFVGDAIYLWKKQSVAGGNRHYYSPSQIKSGQGPFKKVEPKNVNPGAIVVFGDTHTEIITKLKIFPIADKGFCGIGAGRPSRSQTGTEKCDKSYVYSDAREIENPKNSYYTL